MKVFYEITPKSDRAMTMNLKGGGSVAFSGEPRKVWLTENQARAVQNTPGRFELGKPQRFTGCTPPEETTSTIFAGNQIVIHPDGTIGAEPKLEKPAKSSRKRDA